MVSVPKCTKGRGLTMKKWEKPELKVLGVEDTRDGVSMKGIHAPAGFHWVCSLCGGDPRNDINEIGHYVIGQTYHTPNQNCGEANCDNKAWIQVPGEIPPSGVELS